MKAAGRESTFIMSKHLNPLEKELIIRLYKDNPKHETSEFCDINHVSVSAFKKWMKQYEKGGSEGLARADSGIGDVLPPGIDRSEEAYKSEILKLRIENERLKKTTSFRGMKLGNRKMIV